MTCLHLLLLNLVQHGQLAVLCLLTPWEPCSACPGLLCSWDGPRDAGIGAACQAGSKLVFSELESKHGVMEESTAQPVRGFAHCCGAGWGGQQCCKG